MSRGSYHLATIAKGQLGHTSKIREELEELEDAENQSCKIMALVEASDLYGALEAWCKNNNVTMGDLQIMSNITKRAFGNSK